MYHEKQYKGNGGITIRGMIQEETEMFSVHIKVVACS